MASLSVSSLVHLGGLLQKSRSLWPSAVKSGKTGPCTGIRKCEWNSTFYTAAVRLTYTSVVLYGRKPLADTVP